MNYLGIDYSVKNMPALDPGFIPFGIWANAVHRMLLDHVVHHSSPKHRSYSNICLADR